MKKFSVIRVFFKGVWESDLHLLFTDSGLFNWYQTHTHMQKAIDGITPVFNSVLRAGVIVPCKDSLVRTPIFPVKNIFDISQHDDLRFIHDL